MTHYDTLAKDFALDAISIWVDAPLVCVRLSNDEPMTPSAAVLTGGPAALKLHALALKTKGLAPQAVAAATDYSRSGRAALRRIATLTADAVAASQADGDIHEHVRLLTAILDGYFRRIDLTEEARRKGATALPWTHDFAH